jgi:hypothetical protein
MNEQTTTAQQTVTLGGRTYTFTTEGAETRAAVSTLGSLTNSRGTWAGYVVQDNITGRRIVMGSAGRRLSGGAQHQALATLTVEDPA